MASDAPSLEVCAWWLKNHVCMPMDWKTIERLYEEANKRGARLANAQRKQKWKIQP